MVRSTYRLQTMMVQTVVINFENEHLDLHGNSPINTGVRLYRSNAGNYALLQNGDDGHNGSQLAPPLERGGDGQGSVSLPLT